MPTSTAELQLIQLRSGAAALLNPLRRRILEGLREPDSASGLSRRLGVPRQKLNYHLRELEKGTLVEMVEERRKGNCVERVMRATARAYMISPQALGSLAADPDQIRDRFSSAYLVAVAGRAIDDLSTLRAEAGKAGKRLATMCLQTEVRFASAGSRRAFAEELAGEVARLVAKYHDEAAPKARAFKFLVGGYPAARRVPPAEASPSEPSEPEGKR